MTPYRIIIADDHVMLRDGIRKIINETKGMEVVAEASDGLELLSLLKQNPVDMVILDISMPRLRGIEAAQEISKCHPHIKTLFLSMYKKEEYLHLAMSAGAKGYLLKEDTGGELIHAINAIRNGKTYLSPLISKDIPDDLISICRGDGRRTGDPLTPRERQVLKLIAEGKTSKEIADTLIVSYRTVQNHRANICRKLGFRGHNRLLQFALEHRGAL